MRRAIRPATCTQVTSRPSRVCSQSALRSFERDALSSAALRNAPGKYQRSFTVPSTGERFECTLKTFMNTLTLSASRLSQGSCDLLISTMRPSAGETTARGSSGTSRAGSRKNWMMKSARIQSGADHPQPTKNPTRSAAPTAMAAKGQPSRASSGCGYGLTGDYLFSASLRRSESCPCFIASLILFVTLSIVFLGWLPMFLDCSGVQAAMASANPKMKMRILVLGSVDQPVLADPRHHLAQPRADLLDRQLGGHAPLRQQARRAGAVLQHEVLGVLAILDAMQRLLHAGAHARIDDLRPGDVFAVLG